MPDSKDPLPPLLDPHEDPLEVAWRKLEKEWKEPQAHERLLALANSLGRLAELGRRYRRVLEECPERRPEAERGIQAVIAHAMLHFERLAREERLNKSAWRSRLRLSAFLLMLIFILIALLLWRML
ncbi:MAG: hypothetical protein N2515_02845 [Deltaproteobacteria bacterium]|nr:hypothetical protein [Deltaproteobacteria bacterium]